MKGVSKFLLYSFVVFSTALLSFNPANAPKTDFSFPYRQAGLTERQAAAHLLSRFTFGARPGDVDSVVKMGLERWFQQQLDGNLPDDEVQQRLSGYDALNLSNADVVNTFPLPAQVLRMAVKDGVIDKDSIDVGNKKAYKEKLEPYAKQKGFKSQKELVRQFVNQKIVRAAYSRNQLHEVLTDFWFNHFNVSGTKKQCAPFIPAYERDVIRPNVAGKFETLLMATAKSPAMLVYLDNAVSSGDNTEMNKELNEKIHRKMERMGKDSANKNATFYLKRRIQGLNENYAREIMELHTLGVDGGYTQQDVTQAARVLTGWTIYPMENYGDRAAIKKVLGKFSEDDLAKGGFVHDGDFLFAANRHDGDEKTVLGKTFKAGGGYHEGVELLSLLAHHTSTAKFISRKLAVRFVSDNPPQMLVDRMAKTFLDKDGDIKQVLITMVSSPEFWSKDAVREKTKSPFEVVISSVRSLNADVKMPFQLYQWMDRMGQKLYMYQAPTGYPDKAQYWINTGALLNRMNFGLSLASYRIPGVSFDLLALNNGHEPESAEAALETYLKLMMPERDMTATVARLTPLLHNPELEKKVNEAAQTTDVRPRTIDDRRPMNDEKQQVMTANKRADDDNLFDEADENAVRRRHGAKADGAMASMDKNMLSQVVGIIIGSPEFQRR